MYDVKAVTSPIHMDCGPTCLQMLLDYYGIESDLTTLIKECNTNIAGCNAKDMKNVGNKYGLDMKIFSMDVDELLYQDRPAIVWWSYNHFCVFCGLDDEGKVVVCNPDLGRYRMPRSFFKMFYSGISIFNGDPITLDIKTIPERLDEVEPTADMAFVNSEIALALLEMEI